jgi:1-acyl-sn-glycerol-3-phosphate acyltransferase
VRTARPHRLRLDDRPDWFIRATDAVGRLIYRSIARTELHGLEFLRGLDGPLLIVSNHVSNADPPLIGSFMTPALGRRIHWLGKQEALDWPIVGWGIARNAVIGVRRGEADVDAFRAAKRVLDEGHVLCVFPEGTRSPSGALQEAKEGVAILALRTGARIVPVGVAGTIRMWPRGQKLPHPGASVALRVGQPFSLADPGTGAARKAGQRAATVEIMRRIAVLLPPGQRGFYAAAVEAPGAPSGDGPSGPAGSADPEPEWPEGPDGDPVR